MKQFKTTSNRHTEITLANATAVAVDHSGDFIMPDTIAILEHSNSFYFVDTKWVLEDPYVYYSLITINGEVSEFEFRYNEDGTMEDTLPLGDRVFHTFEDDGEAIDFINSKQSI